MCVYAYEYTFLCACSQRPEEAIELIGVEVIDFCGLHYMTVRD